MHVNQTDHIISMQIKSQCHFQNTRLQYFSFHIDFNSQHNNQCILFCRESVQLSHLAALILKSNHQLKWTKTVCWIRMKFIQIVAWIASVIDVAKTFFWCRKIPRIKIHTFSSTKCGKNFPSRNIAKPVQKKEVRDEKKAPNQMKHKRKTERMKKKRRNGNYLCSTRVVCK